MAEIDRLHHLHNTLDRVIGPDDASTAMEFFHRLDQLATKDDIAATKADFAELRVEMHRELAALHRNLFFSLAGLQAAFAALVLGFR